MAWFVAFLGLPFLPEMPAAILAFFLIFVVPGFAILLLAPGEWSPTETLLISALLGAGQLAAISAPALLIHLPLIWALLPHVVLTTALIFIALWSPRSHVVLSRAGLVAPAAGLAMLLLVHATIGDDLLRGGDNWQIMPYVASYEAGQDMNASNPTFDTGRGVLGRYVFHVFAVDQAAMAELADLDIINLNLDYFPLIGVLLAALGVFVLAERLGGGSGGGLIAVACLALLVLTDLQASEGYGVSFLVRAGEDKFFAAFALFPPFVLLCLAPLTDHRRFLHLALGGVAVALTHPFGIAFVALALSALVVGTFREDRPSFVLVALGAAGVLAILAVPAIYQRFFVDDLPGYLFRGERQVSIDLRRLDLPGPLLVLNPRVVTQPLTWVAIALTPLIVRHVEGHRERAFVVLSMLAQPLLLFFPPGAAILAGLASPGLLWRFLTIMPVAAVLAIGLVRLVRPGGRRWVAAGALAFVAFAGIELGARVNESVFEVPEGESAVLAGLERAVSGNDTWRRPGSERVRQIAADIDALVGDEGVILVPPSVQAPGGGSQETFLDLSLPVLVPELDSYTDHRLARLARGDDRVVVIDESSGHGRQAFSIAFYHRRLPPMVSYSAHFNERSITHVLVVKGGYHSQRLTQSDSFRRLGVVADDYVLFLFVPGATSE
ncbi:MAG: hypothetical protein WEB00_03810 [Dehalococcoidia bacterium]